MSAPVGTVVGGGAGGVGSVFGRRAGGCPVVLMFKVLSWNIRGLNGLSKRNAVRQVISSLRNVVVCLQESKVQSVSGSFRKSFVGPYFDKCQFLEANDASGCLITCWNSKFFECSDVLVRNFSITVHLTHRASGVIFFVTNVYGPPTR